VAGAPGRVRRGQDLERDLVARNASTWLGEIALAPGGALVGRVVDARGAPLAAARVIVRPAVAEPREQERAFLPFSWFGDGIRIEGSSGEDGTYRLEGIPCIEVEALAAAGGSLVASSAALEVRAGVEVRVPDLVLPDPDGADLIRGVVTRSGVPVAGIDVSLQSEDGNAAYPSRTSTDAEGRFTLVAARGPAFAVVARDPGTRRSSRAPGVRAGDHDVLVELGEERTLTLHVLDPDGPVPSFSVVAENTTRRGIASARNEEPGLVRVTVPRETFFLNVVAALDRPRRVGPFEPADAPLELEVRLERLGGIAGTVRAGGSARAAVARADVEVHAHAEIASGPYGLLPTDFVTFVDPRAASSARTDAEGRFFLPLQRSGRYRLHAGAPGEARAQAWVSFADGSLQDGLELDLPEAGSLEGALLVAPGVEPRGVWIGASDGESHIELVQTDAGGAFRFPDLTPGSWHVHRIPPTELDGLARNRSTWNVDEGEEPPPWDVRVPAGGTARFDIDVRDEVPCVLEGRLALGGAGARGYSVYLSSLYRDSATLDEDGRFTLRAPKSGPSMLWFGGSGRRPGETVRLVVPLGLRPGPNTWELDLPVGSVSLANLPPVPPDPRQGGAVWPEYALVWQQGDMRWTALLQQRSSGEARIDDVPAGPLILRWRAENAHPQDELHWPVLAELTLGPGDLASVRLP